MLERIKCLCQQKGISIQKLEKELGLSNGSIAKSENMRTDRLLLVAKYFNVSLEYLAGWDDVEWDPSTQEIYVSNEQKEYYADEETNNVAEKIRTNKELSMLFDAAQDSSPEDIMAVYGMLLALKKKEQKNDN